MTNTQVTLVQIDNYGPWTTTPEPRREVDLQTLQSRLYADIAQLVGNRGGYSFFGRFDNIVTVTNGLDVGAHETIQRSLGNRYPVTASMSIGTDPSPARALGAASEQLQTVGSAQDGDRREILAGSPVAPGDRTDRDVQLAHFDIDDATGKYTDRLNEFDTLITVEQAYSELMRHLRRAHDSLAFFVGGDNVIAVCSGMDAGDYRSVIDRIRESVGVELKVGVGRARTAQTAGMAAKHELETCRAEGSAVELAWEGEG